MNQALTEAEADREPDGGSGGPVDPVEVRLMTETTRLRGWP